jgi:hypothetical protein
MIFTTAHAVYINPLAIPALINAVALRGLAGGGMTAAVHEIEWDLIWTHCY